MIVKTTFDGYTVTWEHFNSLYGVPDTLEKRESPAMNGHNRDYFNPANRYRDYDRSFIGVSSADELKKKINLGDLDKSKVDKIYKFSTNFKFNAFVKVKKKGVAGGSVNAVRYLRQEPKCMVHKKRVMMPAKVVKIVLDMGVPYYVSADDLEVVCGYLSRMVKTLECQNWRTNIICSTACKGDRRDILCLTTTVKKAGEKTDYPRLIYATSPSFQRGLGFGWRCKTVNYYLGDMGMSIARVLSHDDLRRFYQQMFKDKNIVTMSAIELVDKLHEIRGHVRNKLLTEKASEDTMLAYLTDLVETRFEENTKN